MRKPDIDERIELARKVAESAGKAKGENIKEKTLELVKECVNLMGIDDIPQLVCFDDVSYKSMPRDKDKGRTSLIFIEFAKNGCVAVVGAGEDIGFSKTSTTGQILSALNIEWDRDSLIILTPHGLEAVAVNKVRDNIFKSRNAIEHYIGEFLLRNDIPVLNMYSHKNFTEKGWKKISGL